MGVARDVTAAVQFVLLHVKEAANWDHARGEADAFERRKEWSALDPVDACVYLGVRQQPRPSGAGTLEEIRAVARASRVFGCGNCGEMAAVAFVFLLDRGVRPLDYLHVAPGDHAFVVVGRPSDGGPAPETWPGAWVCDPWMAGFRDDPSQGAYPTVSFGTMRASFPAMTRVVSQCRVE